MRYFIFMMVVALLPSQAHAKITEAKINAFNEAYKEVYQACDMQAIRQFANTHFANDYVSIFQNPQTGGTDKMTKEATLKQMQASIDYINQNNMTVTDCNTDVTVQNAIIQDEQAVVAIKQTESMTLTAPNGQSVPVTFQTFCNHIMTEDRNKLVVSQSQCMVQQ